MNMRRELLLAVIFAMTAAMPALAQAPAATTVAQPGAAAIPDFGGIWVHPFLGPQYHCGVGEFDPSHTSSLYAALRETHNPAPFHRFPSVQDGNPELAQRVRRLPRLAPGVPGGSAGAGERSLRVPIPTGTRDLSPGRL